MNRAARRAAVARNRVDQACPTCGRALVYVDGNPPTLTHAPPHCASFKTIVERFRADAAARGRPDPTKPPAASS